MSRLLGIAVGLAIAIFLALPASADWTQYHNDRNHTGKDAAADVVTGSGIKWTSPNLVGDVTAEPLFYNGVVYVATMGDYLYALDPADGHVLWSNHLDTAYSNSLPCGKDWATVGIMSTPVIDAATNTLYAVGMISTGVYHLWAVDLATHGTRYTPVTVTTPGFTPAIQNQRGALTFYNGRLYIPFGGRDGDCGNYYGWVFGVNAADGTGLNSYHTAALGSGMWGRSGGVITADGYYAIATGNAVGSDVCESSVYKQQSGVLKLTLGGLKLAQYWAPSNWASLSCSDTDVGSLGPAIVNSGLMFQSGKNGRGYLLNAASLGGINGELGPKGGISICSGAAFGGTAFDSSTGRLFVPCGGRLYALRQSSTTLTPLWNVSNNAGAPIIIGGAVWAIDRNGSGLSVYNQATGGVLFHDGTLGAVPHGFVSPGYGGGLVYAPGDTGSPIVRAYFAAGWIASYDMTGVPTAWVTGQTKTFNVVVHNDGTQAWPSGGSNPVRLDMHFTTRAGGSAVMSSWVTSQIYSLPSDVPVGGSATISVTATAPPRVGSMLLEATMFKNQQFWFKQSASVAVTLYNHWQAQFDISAVPTSWAANETRTFNVGLTNVGDQTWLTTGANPVRLDVNFSTTHNGNRDISCCWKVSKITNLSGDVAPGGSTTVSVTLRAPSAARSYYLEAQLFRDHLAWFPNWTYKLVGVAAATWKATYSMTTPTTWTPGQTQTVNVTVTNTGNQTWNFSGSNPVRLDINFSTTHNGNRDIACCWKTSQIFNLTGDVAPGNSATFTVNVTAPTAPRGYFLEAQLFKDHQFWFATWTYAAVTVS